MNSLSGGNSMTTIAWRLYWEADVGSITCLSGSGTGLENPFVFDAAAREFKRLEAQGLVHVVDERVTRSGGDDVITELSFSKLR